MARKYATSGSSTVASPTDSTLGVTSATTIRPEIYYLTFGSIATPADTAMEWKLQRHTAAGTATSVTPTALDSGDPASTATSGSDHSAEPTYTAGAVLLDVPLNQRGTYQFTARQGCEFKLPATAANGATLYPIHASHTGDVSATIQFFE